MCIYHTACISKQDSFIHLSHLVDGHVVYLSLADARIDAGQLIEHVPHDVTAVLLGHVLPLVADEQRGFRAELVARVDYRS